MDFMKLELQVVPIHDACSTHEGFKVFLIYPPPNGPTQQHVELSLLKSSGVRHNLTAQ